MIHGPVQGPRTVREIANSPEWQKLRAYCVIPEHRKAAPPSGHERLIAAIELAEDRLAKIKTTIRGHEGWRAWDDGECPTCHANKSPQYDFDATLRDLGEMTVFALMGCGGGRFYIRELPRQRGKDQ